jgi:hypothetical protein
LWDRDTDEHDEQQREDHERRSNAGGESCASAAPRLVAVDAYTRVHRTVRSEQGQAKR